MSFEEIKKLTWHQYAGICCHPRDEEGRLVPRFQENDGGEHFATAKDRQFYQWRNRWGWTRAQCETKWAENLELAEVRRKTDMLGLAPDEFDRRVREKMLEIFARRRGG